MPLCPVKPTPAGMATRTFSFNSSMISLGNVIAPIAGGFFSGWIGIKGLFISSAILMGLNGVWVWFALLHKRQIKQSNQ